jgi:hypothetical protein
MATNEGARAQGTVRKRKFMIATDAQHKLGNVSRNEPDLCVIETEDESNYYGQWVTGFGFFNVRFPKKTTRNLTAEECKQYAGQYKIGQVKLFLGHTREQVGHVFGWKINRA